MNLDKIALEYGTDYEWLSKQLLTELKSNKRKMKDIQEIIDGLHENNRTLRKEINKLKKELEKQVD